jgi:hypothetical protein
LESASPSRESALQLEQLRQRVAQGNPELYRHWALYLQVLREGLGPAVEQACFQLAVSQHPERYQALELAKRQHLHRRLASLVMRSGALLTVEQLQALALQMQQRKRRRALRARRQWLQQLQSSPSLEPESSAAAGGDPQNPQGSVHLGLALPIRGSLFGMEPAAQLSPPADALQEPIAGGEQEADVASDLVAAFTQLLDQAHAEPNSTTATLASGDALLPDEPGLLLVWFDGLEAALARRLRTLSHAINVELMRLGLLTTLLPLRLLEAVAAGQIDSQNSAANLVRLSLPVPDPGSEDLLEAQALLLKPADLEAEQPRLRTCRGRLQQARQELRRMAQTYQRLEQRLQVQKAHQLWLNDHATAQNPQTSP